MEISESEIEEALSRGSGFTDGKLRIYKYFNENHSANQNIEFLKNEYGEGGWNCAWGNNLSNSLYHNSKWIVLNKTNYKENELVLSWSKVALIIKALVTQDKYLTAKEKNKYGIVEIDIRIVTGKKNVLDGQYSMF